MEKDIIRKAGIAARDNLTSDERSHFSAVICGKILESELFKSSETIMIYKAVRGEVKLDGLEDEGKKLVYPYCVNDSEMIALIPDNSDSWAKGSFGILEPQPEKSVEIAPEDIDLVICPCTAFDEDGNRMGMGAGYYDRFIPKCTNAKIIAVAFECQKVPSVPTDINDKTMQYIITENNLYEII